MLPRLATLGARIAWARRRLGLTQETFAARIGATRAQVQKVENDVTKRPRNIQVMADALDVPAAWLLFGHAELEQMSEDAIALALAWQTLPPDIQRTIRLIVEANRPHDTPDADPPDPE